MIVITIVIITTIVVMYIQNRKFNEDKNRINQLEQRLDQYYKEREERINKKIKQSEVKGDIDFMYKWIREKSGK